MTTSDSVYLLEWETAFTADGGPIVIPGVSAYYVATNGNDAWSGLLPAPNGTNTDGPLASINRAQALMRTSSIKKTYIRGGVYRVPFEFVLTSLDNNCTYEAYPNETPILHGGDRVSTWTDEGAGVYSASLSTPVDIELFVGFTRYRVAQSNNWNPADPYKTGWYTCDRDGTTKIIRYKSDPNLTTDLARSTMTGSSSRVRVQALDRERLADTIQSISSINTSTGEITMGGDGQYALRAGSTFRFLNRSEWINGYGQFGHRHVDNRLVIKTNDVNFNTTGVYVPRLARLIHLYYAQNVSIKGITFAYTVWYSDAVRITGGGSHTITGCKFYGTGGMYITATTNNIIAWNTIDQCGRNGIEMTGGADNNVVRANTITNVGQVRLEAMAIGGNQINNNTIENNTIDKSARYGISIKNWASFNVNLNNIIRWNKITNTCLETADGGAIEMLGRSGAMTNAQVYGNWIENVYGLATTTAGAWLYPYKGFGIYLDDQTSAVTVADNFVKNCSWAGVFIHGGDNNAVRNNFFSMVADGYSALRIEYVPQAISTGNDAGLPKNNLFELNICYGEVTTADYWDLLSAGSYTIRNNLVYRTAAFTNSGDLVSDPLFTNPTNGDYSLQVTSPAFGKGLHDLPWSKMGTAGYPAPPTATNPLVYKTLRASNYTYNHPSAPGPYVARFKDGVNYRREIARGANNYGAAQMSWGEASLINHDGYYNWLYELNAATDGRKAVIKIGSSDQLHYLSFAPLFYGQIEQFWMAEEMLRLRWRDRMAEIIDKSIQTKRYKGNNVAPDGVEGGENQEGRCKPVLYGAARNLTPILVNEQRPIYQVSDGICQVLAARDGGVPLVLSGAYSVLTQMYESSLVPPVGGYKIYSGVEGTFIRLQNFPRQALTCDAAEGGSDDNRSAARIFRRILTERAGVLDSDLALNDLETLNLANNSVISGLWFGDSEITIQEALNRLSVSVGGWYGINSSGLWTMKRIEDPDSQNAVLRLQPYLLDTAAVSTTDANILSFQWLEDDSDQRGVPVKYVKIGYDPNLTIQVENDLGGDKTSSTDPVRSPVSTTAGLQNREWLKNEFRYYVADDSQSGSTVILKHPTAKEWEINVYYRDKSAAITEAIRQYNLRQRIPRVAEIRLPLSPKTAILDLGTIVSVKNEAYGLSTFKNFIVTSIDYNAGENLVSITVRR